MQSSCTTYDVTETDVLIAGGGIAGLSAALQASLANQHVMIISKGSYASKGILGFNAAVGKNDSEELFYADTQRSGCGIGDRELITVLVERSCGIVPFMESLGQNFDRDSLTGEYHLLKPLGCSVPRLVHSENKTGIRSIELLTRRLRKLGTSQYDGISLLRILRNGQGAAGALCYDRNAGKLMVIKAKSVILASGGVHLMRNSTYPEDMTADGYASAYIAGAGLTDMEFIQFEPCRAVYPKPLGLSTTLLSKGGVLLNGKGERFVLKHAHNESSVNKDELCRLIAQEIRNGNTSEHGGVLLDLTELPEYEIKKNHYLYYKRFIDAGIDLTKDVIEVAPAAHSFMGGVMIDSKAGTGVPGLFASGEVTGGIHGANRIGGSAGTEVYVFGTIAGKSAADHAGGIKNHADIIKSANTCIAEMLSSGTVSGSYESDVGDIRGLLLDTMSAYMGPIRNSSGLLNALNAIDGLEGCLRSIKPSTGAEIAEMTAIKNMLLISRLSCEAAHKRTESRGVHFRTDHPGRNDDDWKVNINFTKESGSKVKIRGYK